MCCIEHQCVVLNVNVLYWTSMCCTKHQCVVLNINVLCWTSTCCTEYQCPYILSPEWKHKCVNTKAGLLWSEKHNKFYFFPSRVLSGDIKRYRNNKVSCRLITYSTSKKRTWKINVSFAFTEHRIKSKRRCILTCFIFLYSLAMYYFLSVCPLYPWGMIALNTVSKYRNTVSFCCGG